MKKIFLLVTISFSVLILFSCSKPRIVRELPVGNLSKISPKQSPNTNGNEVAPIQLPNNVNIVDPCEKEENFTTNLPFDGIITSSEFVRRTFPLKDYNKEAIDYLTSNVESVTFLTSLEGYAAFSHPPTERYIVRYELPMTGSIGGTDIFHFSPKDNKIFFTVLPEPINSEFWDSHPFVTNDVIGNQLLIWASDRLDNKGGYSFPYKNEGNTDLYFAFKRPFENWNEVQVHNFSEVLNEINTKYSEASPFLYCKCYNPTLLFASNRDSKDSTFDIFYVNLEVDFINQKITAKGSVKKLDYGNQTINTIADERFPFIPYPHVNKLSGESNIYFTSNRNKDSTVFVTKDTLGKETHIVLKNVGGYDLYRFPLKERDFKCAPPPPPPPPKLNIVVHLNEYCYDYTGKPTDSLLDVDGQYMMNNQICVAKRTYELELGKKYLLETKDTRVGCSTPCDSCFGSKLEFFTPKVIYKDTTIRLTLSKHCFKKAPKTFSFSMKKGLAFFITGYWYPTTVDNLNEFWRRSASGCLSLSNFIDSTDFKPDEKHFYVTAAEVNDRWLNDSFYPTIDSLLQLLDTCYKNQRIVITVHGYTDPCPLRTVRDQSGRIIQDSTRFTCDETFVFHKNNVSIVVPQGILMKFPDLKTTDGKSFKPPFGPQQGNYVLAMLRAYFTQETIKKGFRKKYSNYPEKLRLFDDYVTFILDAYGIYDERPPCPEIDKDIVGVELANKPYPPTLNEPCNLPHSRRVMIYVDVVSQSMVERKVFAREECGKISYITYVEKKKEKTVEKKKTRVEAVVVEELVVNLDTLESLIEEVTKKPKEITCPGKCFRVVYGPARTMEEYVFLSNLLKSLGFELDEDESQNLRLVSKEKFHTEKEAMDLIKRLREELNKLTPIIDINRVKAIIEQI
ncbi:MAG: hypothetical protein N2560_04415 [Ignavibacteria bacterium]|nr:hypothetical protein [Ignavibacteria bacterium]